MVTTESEWDDATRERALALTAYEDGLCGCGCGRPYSESSKHARGYMVHRVTCYARKAIDDLKAQDAAAHENDGDDRWSRGVRYIAVPADENQMAAVSKRPSQRFRDREAPSD